MCQRHVRTRRRTTPSAATAIWIPTGTRWRRSRRARTSRDSAHQQAHDSREKRQRRPGPGHRPRAGGDEHGRRGRNADIREGAEERGQQACRRTDEHRHQVHGDLRARALHVDLLLRQRRRRAHRRHLARHHSVGRRARASEQSSAQQEGRGAGHHPMVPGGTRDPADTPASRGHAMAGRGLSGLDNENVVLVPRPLPTCTRRQ